MSPEPAAGRSTLGSTSTVRWRALGRVLRADRPPEVGRRREHRAELPEGRSWLAALRRYVAFIAVAHLAWEVVQLPLYTIWDEAGAGEIAFAVLHCTGGDLLIAGASLVLALLLVGEPAWPVRGYLSVAALAVAFGALYTVFSEWLNTEVRGSWAYVEAMPVVPVSGTGLAPLAQWLIVPPAGLWWARRPVAASFASTAPGTAP